MVLSMMPLLYMYLTKLLISLASGSVGSWSIYCISFGLLGGQAVLYVSICVFYHYTQTLVGLMCGPPIVIFYSDLRACISNLLS